MGKHAFCQCEDVVMAFTSRGSQCPGIIAMFFFSLFVPQMTKFGSATDIPARFIERNVSIRGRLRNITEKGLEVEHIPIYVPLFSPLFTKRKEPHDPPCSPSGRPPHSL